MNNSKINKMVTIHRTDTMRAQCSTLSSLRVLLYIYSLWEPYNCISSSISIEVPVVADATSPFFFFF